MDCLVKKFPITGVLQKQNKPTKPCIKEMLGYTNLNCFFTTNTLRAFNKLMFFMNFHEKNAICSIAHTSLELLFYEKCYKISVPRNPLLKLFSYHSVIAGYYSFIINSTWNWDISLLFTTISTMFYIYILLWRQYSTNK